MGKKGELLMHGMPALSADLWRITADGPQGHLGRVAGSSILLCRIARRFLRFYASPSGRHGDSSVCTSH